MAPATTASAGSTPVTDRSGPAAGPNPVTPPRASTIDAAAARTVAAAHARSSDEQGSVRAEVLAAIQTAGYVRHLVPARWGGRAGGFAELTRAVDELGQACTSAAWLASLFAYSARLGAFLPADGQAELWANGPDTLVAAALVPGGAARATADGWLVSGSWPYTSGVDRADWALVCVRPPDTEAGDGPLFVAVPRGAFSIQNTWRTLGMRATASQTLILDEAPVASRLTFRGAAAAAGRSPLDPAAPFGVPLRAISGLTFAAPLLGAARGAFADFLRGRPTGAPAPVSVARAAGEIDAADLLLRRVADTADHQEPTAALIARGLRDSALAATCLVDAVDRLAAAAGTAGQDPDRPLQRFWRDIHTASTHVALRFDQAAANYLDLLGRTAGAGLDRAAQTT
ncbi:Alkylation response protein AidB-like acyl-CoA dehydrogenase [Frankia sp. AiPs1]|uniref:acyl-CoA dehydrogenase family protein n=1 Tax=Frankia sp. AiPa1 TaxID=573492 RepID=UPI00202AF3FA|nr:acyl-CoA dehydrogenase family protein [Frankia sp. AiPa1]MCL9760522.1 acyl-CoA dehydrogenase family protein [Frankia sp. AiPa1]